MAILSELVLYPVKSCAGISLPEATLTRAGLAHETIHDREWMVVSEDGQFLSQREHPRMALVVPRLAGAMLELSAPGMPRLDVSLAMPAAACAPTREVQVWDDRVPAFDCGAAAGAWFSQVLGLPCRLVRFHTHARRLASARWTGKLLAPTRFADAFPLLVIGAASLADLNDKLRAAGRDPLPMNRFRPNLVIDAMEPFEEDYVESFALGAAQVRPVKPCARCPIPSVDQSSGLHGLDPLDILHSYRSKPAMDDAICFGMNAIVGAGEGERLRVGQQVELALAF